MQPRGTVGEPMQTSSLAVSPGTLSSGAVLPPGDSGKLEERMKPPGKREIRRKMLLNLAESARIADEGATMAGFVQGLLPEDHPEFNRHCERVREVGRAVHRRLLTMAGFEAVPK